MKKLDDVHFLKEGPHSVTGTSAYNRLLNLLMRMSSETIQIGRNNAGGIRLEVMPGRDVGVSPEITSQDNSITVTPANSGYDLSSAIQVAGGDYCRVTRSGNTFTVNCSDGSRINLSIGTVTTIAPGAQAWASITGSAPDKVLNLGIPQGANGREMNLSIGTVSTLPAGSSATATLSGSPPNFTLSLGIPKGQDGNGVVYGSNPVKVVADPQTGTFTVSLDLSAVAPLRFYVDPVTGAATISLDLSGFQDGVLAIINGALTTIPTSVCDNA